MNKETELDHPMNKETELEKLQAAIDHVEDVIPHDQLPPEYDAWVERRNQLNHQLNRP